MNEGIDPINELQEIMAGRGYFYRLLARVFAKEVDAEFLMFLRDQKDLLAAMRELSRRGQQELKEFFQRITENAEERTTKDVVLELAVEYAALFLGAGRSAGKSVLPYASVYLSADKSLMQEPYAKIREFYGRAGFARAEESRELEDHVSIVFEFLSRMADGTANALANGDIGAAQEKLALQRDFLDNYVLTWVPTLCHDLARRDSTGFYRSFALITAAFLKTDRGEVEEIIGELEEVGEGIS